MTMPLSRRDFLQAAGTGAGVWVPSTVHGYTGAEMSRRAAQAGGELTALGLSVRDLDTPALVVDLDALETNIATLQHTVARNGIASRPHAKTHKCPAIARMQLEAGSVGICVAKASVDGSSPAISGHRKAGHFRRPETAREFYFMGSRTRKDLSLVKPGPPGP